MNRQLQEAAHGLALSMKTPNPSLSIPVLHLQRFLNAHFARTQLSPDGIIDLGSEPIRALARAIDRAIGRNVLRPIDGYMRRKAMERIATQFVTCFDEDNARLASLLDLQLKQHGYASEDRSTPVCPP